MEKIGIFGGTFNPPHLGHINGAIACTKTLGLNRVFFVPANIPPHKALPQNTATPKERLEMTALAAGLVPGASVLELELTRPGKSYTSDTVMAIHKEYPDAALYFIMGSDMLKSFLTWHKPDIILKHCTIAALCRDPQDLTQMKPLAREIEHALGGKIVLINHHIIALSSTDIRGGQKLDLMPSAVLDYIKEHNLYQ